MVYFLCFGGGFVVGFVATAFVLRVLTGVEAILSDAEDRADVMEERP